MNEILKFLGGVSVMVAAAAWLARTLISHQFTKDLEKFKTDLRQAAFEHEVRFRRSDDKVAEHIYQIYGHLRTLRNAVGSYINFIERSDQPSKKEKLETVDKANREFWEYYGANRLYIPPALDKKVESLGERLTKIANEFTYGLEREKRGTYDGPDHWAQAFEAVKNDANPVFEELIYAFRRRLGVADDSEQIA